MRLQPPASRLNPSHHLKRYKCRGMVIAERAGAAARKLRLEGLQAAANDFWALLCDYSTAPSTAKLTQQVQ